MAELEAAWTHIEASLVGSLDGFDGCVLTPALEILHAAGLGDTPLRFLASGLTARIRDKTSPAFLKALREVDWDQEDSDGGNMSSPGSVSALFVECHERCFFVCFLADSTCLYFP